MSPVYLCVMLDNEFLQRDVLLCQPGKPIKEQSGEPPGARGRNRYLVILLNLSKIGASNLTISTKGLTAKSRRSSEDNTSGVT